MQLTSNALDILKSRYLLKDQGGNVVETPESMVDRVVNFIYPDSIEDREKLKETIISKRLMPSTPMLLNAGTKDPQLFSCFALDIEDNIESILKTLHDAVIIHKSGGGCIAEGAFVVSNNGVEKIEQVYEKVTTKEIKEENFAYKNCRLQTIAFDKESGSFCKDFITRVWKYELNPSDQYSIHLDDGNILTTSWWHPFFVLDEEGNISLIQAKDLKKEDLIISSSASTPKAWPIENYAEVDTLKLSEPFGWLAGYFIGDGHLGYESRGKEYLRLRWFDGEIDGPLSFASQVLALLGSYVTPSGPEKRGNTFTLTCNHQNIVKLLSKILEAKPGPKFSTVCIPSFIWRSPISVIQAFLAGLFDSDGYMDFRKPRLSYTTGSEKLAKELRLLLSAVGVSSYSRAREPRGKSRITHYEISITSNALLNLAPQILPFMQKKIRKERLILSISSNKLHRPFITRTWLSYKKVKELLERGGISLSGTDIHRKKIKVGNKNIWLARWRQGLRVSDFKAHEILSCILEILPNDPEILKLLNLLEQKVKVLKIEKGGTTKHLYDFSVEKQENYLAGTATFSVIHNTGIGFSKLRGRGERIYFGEKENPLTKIGHASGPVSFMKIFDTATGEISQGGVRRGANIGILNVDHKDLIEFITCKQKEGEFKNFNISVMVNNKFFEDVITNNPELYPCNKTAKEIFDLIVEGNWKSGEPGLLFYDRINLDNNVEKLNGNIYLANPCLTGDMKIAVVNTNGIPIKELAEAGKDIDVYCLDNYGELCIRTMRNPRITGYNKKILKITLDDGSILRCTENEQIRLRDLSYKYANKLEIGDSLAIVSRAEKPLAAVIEQKFVNKKPYVWLQNFVSGKTFTEHRIVYQHFSRSEVEANFVLHHKDYNSLNNDFENLAYLSKKEHDELHKDDKRGDKNPIHKILADPIRSISYRNNLSKAVKGTLNGRFNGINNQELLVQVSEWIKGLKYIPSKKEYFKAATENNWPKGLSSYRYKAFKNLGDLISQASSLAQVFISNISHPTGPIETRLAYCRTKTNLPLVVKNKEIFVQKRCEGCGKEFEKHFIDREISYCSLSCSLKHLPYEKRVKGIENHRAVMKKYICQIQTKQIEVYKKLKQELGRDPLKKEWEITCKKNNIPIRFHKGTFKGFRELKERADCWNHKVISIEEDGLETVYNGTVDEFHNCFVSCNPSIKNEYPTSIWINRKNCGEIPLFSKECCNLAALNVSKFIKDGELAVHELKATVRIAVQFLDRALDVARYPLPEIEEAAKKTRKIGLGLMGFADALIKLGIVYGSDECIEFIHTLMSIIKSEATSTSESLLKIGFGSPPHPWIVENIKRKNSSLLTCAPTGTTSVIAGCSGGIEPIFGLCFEQFRLDKKTIQIEPLVLEVLKDKPEVIAKAFKAKTLVEANNTLMEHLDPNLWITADRVSIEDHIKVQATFQKYVDQSISKTINCPNNTTKEQIADALTNAWRSGCKGITIYRDGSRTEQVLRSKDSINKRERPNVLPGQTFRYNMPVLEGPNKGEKHNIYITVNINGDGKPYEVFVMDSDSDNKDMKDIQVIESVARMVSLALRYHTPLEEIIKQLEKIRGTHMFSIPTFLASALKNFLSPESPMLKCPQCGGQLRPSSGCLSCTCGYSKCSSG